MSWVSAGPSGVFGIKPNGSIYYLQNSRLVENPSQQLLNQDRWTRVIGHSDYYLQWKLSVENLPDILNKLVIWFH